ncbi:MAG: type IV pilus secretin PilQ [Gammaproteobacteria bacterium]|nr:type IV pilus secretin PilQ [Gammaproteobacteria bacterium]
MKYFPGKKLFILFSILGLMLSFNVCLAANVNKPASVSSNNGRLSFYFQDIEIKTLLQLIAKSSGLNFVIGETVKGNTTLNLKNVSWEEALNIVMQSNGLAARRVDNVMLISTVEDLTTNESKKLQSEETLSNLSPLTQTILQLKYTNATDMAALLKGTQSNLLSSRGQVGIDTHTNSLLIRDIKKNVADVTKAIRKLDVPARQVLIEARIVNLDVDFERELGARFGITNPQHLTGTFTGANSLAQGTTMPNVATPAGIIDPTQRLNFNNAASTIFGTNPGSLGIAVAKVAGVYLDMELSALEGEDHLEVISSPRVMTSNQQKAVIQTGEEIPYQESTSSGATSVSFKNAVLSLEITPQITPDNKIILNVKATQDTRGANTVISGGGGTTSTSIPSINTQAVQSNVILNNNETIVLGGVYKQTKQKTTEKIPYLSSIPVLGYLFKHTSDHDIKTELLVFITPKIICPLTGAPLKDQG